MPRRQFLLQWKVPKAGHEWIDAPLVEKDHVAEEPSRVLVVKPSPDPGEYDYYQPLRQETALFRVLASLPLEEDAIRQFADRYGLLADGDLAHAKGGRYAFEALRLSGKRIPVRRGDTWDRWVNQILSLKTCLALWQKAQAGDRPYLKSVLTIMPSAEGQLEWLSALVRFSDTGVILPSENYLAHPLRATLVSRFHGKSVPMSEPGGFCFGAGEMQPPASFYAGQRVGFPVAAAVRGRIGGFGMTFPANSIDRRDPVAVAQAMVTTEIMRNLSAGLAPIIVPHPGTSWGELCFVPGTLVEGVWLQFAEAVCGDKTYRECQVCGKPFELSPDVARTNKLFCGDSCKMQAYRLRRGKSADLWSQGHSIEQIVEILGSDAPQVTKWIVQHLAARDLTAKDIADQLKIGFSEVRKLMRKKNGKE